MSMCDLHDNVETQCGIVILTQLQMFKRVHSNLLLDETVGRFWKMNQLLSDELQSRLQDPVRL